VSLYDQGALQNRISAAAGVHSETSSSHINAVTFERSVVGSEQSQAVRLERSRWPTVRAYDAPPRHAVAKQCHDMADLTRSSPADDFGDVSIRSDLTRRYLLDDGEYEFGVVVIH
jgi:hypothetical protein